MEKKEKVKKPLYKKWWFWVIVVSLVGAIGSGLSGGGEQADQPSTGQTETQAPASTLEPSETPEAAPSESGPMIVEISVSAGGDAGRPEFTVNTNLPDKTELMLSLSGDDFNGQAKVTVKNGIATSEAFASGRDALSGVYSLDVSMSIPRLQPDSVRSVIGEKGENISGPYVEKDDITGENWVYAEAIYKYES